MDEIITPIETEKPSYKGLLIFQTIVVIILAATLAYTLYTLGDMKSNEPVLINKSINEGYTNGANDAINYIANQASQCKQIFLNVSGQETEIFGVKCGCPYPQ
jgi:hypothetical protein